MSLGLLTIGEVVGLHAIGLEFLYKLFHMVFTSPLMLLASASPDNAGIT
jgi:hypothetical protein